MAGRSTAKTADIGTRQRLMAATEEIMREDGYAAATSRRVAERAGVRSALVYYYFPTMDDLFLAVLSDSGDQALERMRQALTDDGFDAVFPVEDVVDPRKRVISGYGR